MEGEEYEAVIVRMGLSGSSRHLIVASGSYILLWGPLWGPEHFWLYPAASGCWQYKTAHLSPAKSNKPVFSEIYPEDSCSAQNIGDGLRMPSYPAVRF